MSRKRPGARSRSMARFTARSSSIRCSDQLAAIHVFSETTGMYRSAISGDFAHHSQVALDNRKQIVLEAPVWEY